MPQTPNGSFANEIQDIFYLHSRCLLLNRVAPPENEPKTAPPLKHLHDRASSVHLLSYSVVLKATALGKNPFRCAFQCQRQCFRPWKAHGKICLSFLESAHLFSATPLFYTNFTHNTNPFSQSIGDISVLFCHPFLSAFLSPAYRMHTSRKHNFSISTVRPRASG